MSLLDILKAYHMRFETAPDRQKEIRRIWVLSMNRRRANPTAKRTMTKLRRLLPPGSHNGNTPLKLMSSRRSSCDAILILGRKAPIVLRMPTCSKASSALIGETESLTGNYLHRPTSISLTCFEPVQTGIGFFPDARPVPPHRRSARRARANGFQSSERLKAQ